MEPTAPTNWQAKRGAWLVYFRFMGFQPWTYDVPSERWQVEAFERTSDEPYPRGIAFVTHIEHDILAEIEAQQTAWICGGKLYPDGFTQVGYLFAAPTRCGIATAIMDMILDRWPNTQWSGATESGEAFEEAYRSRKHA